MRDVYAVEERGHFISGAVLKEHTLGLVGNSSLENIKISRSRAFSPTVKFQARAREYLENYLMKY